MIISHRHKFIFLHSLKTAGSSITLALAPFLAEDDFMSLDHFTIDDFKSAGVLPRPVFNERHVRILHDSGFETAARQMSAALAQGSLHGISDKLDSFGLFSALQSCGLYKHEYRQHCRAGDARTLVGEKDWNHYFKFAFERNPWDKMVSLYSWRWSSRYTDFVNRTALQGDRSMNFDAYHKPSFEQFIMSFNSTYAEQKAARSHIFSNWPIYTIDNDVVVDHLARYENLSQEVRLIGDKIGIKIGEMPNAKTGIRRESKAVLYSKEMSDMVGRKCGYEIAAMNYIFPSSLATV